MNFNSYKKSYLFISVFIFFFLFIVPLSRAEQINNDLTKQGFSMEGMEDPEGSLQEKKLTSVFQSVATPRELISSVDVKIPLNGQLNAVFFLEKPYITDFAGRDIGRNYNAMIGFQIMLR